MWGKCVCGVRGCEVESKGVGKVHVWGREGVMWRGGGRGVGKVWGRGVGEDAVLRVRRVERAIQILFHTTWRELYSRHRVCKCMLVNYCLLYHQLTGLHLHDSSHLPIIDFP